MPQGKPMDVKIIPTVFVHDLPAFEERLELYEAITDKVQLDAADSEFTTQPTLGIERLVEQATTLDRELHLMVNEPAEWLELAAENAIDTVIGQIEMMGNQGEFVETAKSLGLKAGLAVDLETNLDDLDWEVVKTASQLLIMTIRAGKEGQKLDKRGLDKVKTLRQKGYLGIIGVDGGVNETTVKACVAAGANSLAVGSALWKADDAAAEFKKLTNLANGL